MTFAENKKLALGLIEEYSPSNKALTDDEDIATRLCLVYATNYQELSQNKKILKTKVLRNLGAETGDGYAEMNMPYDLYQVRRVVAMDSNNEELEANYRILGKKIYIDRSKDAKYVMEYFAYPTVINEQTEDDFVLEIDQDAQMILPYAVANDILKVDPSSDYTAFYNEYQRKLNSLDARREIASAVVEEGDI